MGTPTPITSREAVSASFEQQNATDHWHYAEHGGIDQRIVALGFVSGPAWGGRTFIIAKAVLADEPPEVTNWWHR